MRAKCWKSRRANELSRCHSPNYLCYPSGREICQREGGHLSDIKYIEPVSFLLVSAVKIYRVDGRFTSLIIVETRELGIAKSSFTDDFATICVIGPHRRSVASRIWGITVDDALATRQRAARSIVDGFSIARVICICAWVHACARNRSVVGVEITAIARGAIRKYDTKGGEVCISELSCADLTACCEMRSRVRRIGRENHLVSLAREIDFASVRGNGRERKRERYIEEKERWGREAERSVRSKIAREIRLDKHGITLNIYVSRYLLFIDVQSERNSRITWDNRKLYVLWEKTSSIVRDNDEYKQRKIPEQAM